MNGAVTSHLTRYLGILGVSIVPDVVVRQNLGPRWLGRCVWLADRPHNTTIELQRAILSDDRTLARVVAHEVIHHRDLITMSPSTRTLLGFGIRPASHGSTFMEGARRINTIEGEGFVTKESDREYVQAPSGRRFLVLIVPHHPGSGRPLGWCWAARLGPAAKIGARRYVEKYGARLVYAEDDRWTHGAKIERFAGYSLPRSAEDAARLQALWKTAPSAPSSLYAGAGEP